MSQFIKSIAFDVKNSLCNEFALQLNQVHQLLAAAFGYKTFAASAKDASASSANPQLVVVNSELLAVRIKKLGLAIDPMECIEKIIVAMEYASKTYGTRFCTLENAANCLSEFNWDPVVADFPEFDKVKAFVGSQNMDLQAYLFGRDLVISDEGICFELRSATRRSDAYKEGRVWITVSTHVLLKKVGPCCYSGFTFIKTKWLADGSDVIGIMKSMSNESALAIEVMMKKRKIDFNIDISISDLDLFKEKIRSDAVLMTLKEIKYKISQSKRRIDSGKLKINSSSLIKARIDEARLELLEEIKADREIVIYQIDKIRQKHMEMPKTLIPWIESELIEKGRFIDIGAKRIHDELIYNSVAVVINSVSSGIFFERLANIFQVDKNDVIIIQGNKVRISYEENVKDFLKYNGFSFDVFARSWDAPNDIAFDLIVGKLIMIYKVVIELDSMIISTLNGVPTFEDDMGTQD